METLANIIENVTTITAAIGTMFTNLGSIWVVWLPVTFVVFGKIYGYFRSLLMFRGGKRKSRP